jgi:hypothetical protein
MKRRWIALAFCALLAASGARAAGTGIPMLNKDAVSQGSAKVGLAKGSVSLKLTLAPLPAQIDTGTEQFEATIYKAYLVSTADPAMEIPLGNVYPTTLSKAGLKAALKGDLTQMGFDKVVVVAYSKDGLHSFDVLTGTLVAP